MNQKRILIVDDSPILLKALTNVLSGAGYTVLKAEDGAAAVSIARRERPDLMLLDITFPPDVAHGGGVPWDGFLIMNWIRRMDECRGIPILIISGSEPAVFKKRALDAGAVGYFQKPVEPTDLLGEIRRILGDADSPLPGSIAEGPGEPAAVPPSSPGPLRMA